jgi:hypothetical protein
MHRASTDHHPFGHLDPSVWKASKVAHITLAVIGTILIFPAGLVFYVLSQALDYQYSFFSNPGTILLSGSALIGSVSGGFAWCALCLLFFKRCDLHWQRIAWTTCAIFGYLTTPCIIGWIVWIMSEQSSADEAVLIYFGIFTTTVCCMVIGRKNARLAQQSLKRNLAHPSIWP